MNLLAQLTTMESESSASPAGLIVGLIFAVVALAGLWKTFQKAGQPGWAAIIPIYNIYIMIKIAGRPSWWLLLFLIPIVNIVVQVIVAIDIAKAFGKSSLFGVIGLWLFSFIGYLMLGFGDAQYTDAQPAQPAQQVQTPPTPPTQSTPPQNSL